MSDVIVENLNNDTIVAGINLDIANGSISNVFVRNLDGTKASIAYGVIIGENSSGATITNLNISDIDNTDTAANSRGLYMFSGVDNCSINMVVTGCSGTGVEIAAAACDRNVLIGRSTNNGTNLTDNGTATNTAAFDSA